VRRGAMARATLRVVETHDAESGDLAYFVAFKTHSRTTLDRIAAMLDVAIRFECSEDDGDADLADALRNRARTKGRTHA
jgi:hypothetical protein